MKVNTKSKIIEAVRVLLLVFPSLSVDSAVIYNQPEKYKNEPTLLNIFTKKNKYWSDGSKIVVFIKPINSLEHKFFVMDWLGVSPTKYKEMLESSVYSGDSANVTEVDSDEQMMVVISQTPNSIGYIDNKVLLRGERNVKILTR
jgi:ABC-type phosphate transport system substrate-binding protein